MNMTTTQKIIVKDIRSKESGTMDSETFNKESLYQASIAVARTMFQKGLLDEDTYYRMDTFLLEKYKPLLGNFINGKSPKVLD